jgi:hypothetical protein
MNNKLKKIIFDLIDTKTKGVDTYHHNGSMWLIFTDQKKWVIEFTKQGTLWYNFNFFQQFFRYLSLDVIENQHYITEWVEVILKNGVGYTSPTGEWEPVRVEDTIQNGVRSTDSWAGNPFVSVESIIQNGVKETDFYTGNLLYDVEDTIQNGVKHTEPGGYLGSIEMKGKIVHQLESPKQNNEVEDIIKNGVINTNWSCLPKKSSVEDTIQNGVINTLTIEGERAVVIDDTIQNGVKETKHNPFDDGLAMEEAIQIGIKKTKAMDEWVNTERIIENTIQNGIKETKTPGEDGDLMSTLDFMSDNNTVSVPKMIDDIITNGIKETKKLEHDRTTYHGYFNRERGSHTPLDTVQDVLKNGIKHTQPHVLEILNPIGFEPTLKENKRMNEVNNVLDKGIKEVIELPDQSGELNGYGEYYARQKNRTYPHTDTVNDVIRDGVKETNWRTVENFPEFEERVIQNGIKETWGYERQPQTRVNDVIQTGKKI